MLKLPKEQSGLKIPSIEDEVYYPTEEGVGAIALSYRQKIEDVRRQGTLLTIKDKERQKAKALKEANEAVFQQAMFESNVDAIAETIEKQRKAELEAKLKAQEDAILSYAESNPELQLKLSTSLEESKAFAEGDVFIRDRKQLANMAVAQSFIEELNANNDKWWQDIADIPEVLVEEVVNFFKVDYETENFVRANSIAQKTLSPSDYKRFLAASAKKAEDERFFDNKDRIVEEMSMAVASTIGEASTDDTLDNVWAAVDITGLGLFKTIRKGGEKVLSLGKRNLGKEEIELEARKIADELDARPDVKYQYFDEAGEELSKDAVVAKVSDSLAQGVKPKITVRQTPLASATQKVMNNLAENPTSPKAQRDFKTVMGASDEVLEDAQSFANTGKANDSFAESADIVKGMSIHDDIMETLNNSALPVKIRENVKKWVGESKDVLDAIPPAAVDRAIRNFLKEQSDIGSELSLKTQNEIKKALEISSGPTDIAKFKLSIDKQGLPAGYVAKIAKGNGRTYSKQEAELLKEEIAEHYSSKVIRAEEGGYLLELDIPITNLADVAKKTFNVQRAATYYRWAANPADVIDDSLHNIFRAGDETLGNLQQFMQKAVRNLGVMSKEAFKDLDTFVNTQIKNNVEEWYDPDTLVATYRDVMGANIQASQVTGYYILREMNDYMYREVNRKLREIHSVNGYSQWDIAKADGTRWLSGIIAKPVTSQNLDPQELIFDASTNRVVSLSGGFTRERIAELKEQGYELFGMESGSMKTIAEWTGRERASQLYGGAGHGIVSHAILPITRATQKELPLNPLPYVGGPRILYDAPHVVKFGRERTLSPALGGFRQRLQDVALGSTKVKAIGRKAVSFIKEVQNTLKKVDAGEITEEMADEALQKLDMKGLRGLLDYDLPSGKAALNSVRGARQLFDELGVTVDDTVELVRDGGSVRGDINIANPLARDGEAARAIHNNSRFKKRTERRLQDLEGGVPMTNILESMSRSFSSMARFVSYQQAKELWANNFLHNYVRNGNYLDVSPSATITEALNAPVRQGIPFSKRQEILASQNYVKQVIGYQSVDESKQEVLTNALADYIWNSSQDKKLFEKGGSWLAGKVADKAQADLAGTLKKYTFHAKLGMFRPDNMLQQTMAGLSAIAIAPRYAPQAFKGAWHINKALLVSDGGTNLKMLKAYAKKVRKEVGDQEEFVKEIQDFIAFGGDNYSANIAEIAVTAGGKLKTSRLDKILHMGSAPFRFGDRTSRTMAYSIARAEIKDGKAQNRLGKKVTDPNSDEGASWIIDRMNNLILGMSRADVQEIARTDLGGMALQFMSYPMRMLTVFLGRTLTGPEKARLGLFYVATAGAGAVPLATTMLDYMEARHNLDQSTSKLVYNGLIDSMMLEFFGADTDFSRQVAAGEIVDQWVEDFQKSNVAELLGGASLSTVYSGYETLQNEIKKWSAAGADPDKVFSEATAAFIKNQVVSLNRLDKAYIGWQMGEALDKVGDPMFTVSKKEAILTLLGFPYGKQDEISYLYKLKRNDREVVKVYREWFNDLRNARYEAVKRGDEGEVENIDRSLAALKMTLMNQENPDVIDQVNIGFDVRPLPREEKMKEELKRVPDVTEEQ